MTTDLASQPTGLDLTVERDDLHNFAIADTCDHTKEVSPDTIACYLRNSFRQKVHYDIVHGSQERIDALDFNIASPRICTLQTMIHSPDLTKCDTCKVSFRELFDRTGPAKQQSRSPGTAFVPRQEASQRILHTYEISTVQTKQEILEMHDLFMRNWESMVALFLHYTEELADACEDGDTDFAVMHLYQCALIFSMVQCLKKPKFPVYDNLLLVSQRQIFVQSRVRTYDASDRTVQLSDTFVLSTKFADSGVDSYITTALIEMTSLMPSMANRIVFNGLYPWRHLNYSFRIAPQGVKLVFPTASMSNKDYFGKIGYELRNSLHISQQKKLFTDGSNVIKLTDCLVEAARSHCVELVSALYVLYHTYAPIYGKEQSFKLTLAACYIFSPRMSSVVVLEDLECLFLPLACEYSGVKIALGDGKCFDFDFVKDVCASLCGFFICQIADRIKSVWIPSVPFPLRNTINCLKADRGKYLWSPEKWTSLDQIYPACAESSQVSTVADYFKVSCRKIKAQIVHEALDFIIPEEKQAAFMPIALRDRVDCPVAMPDIALAFSRFSFPTLMTAHGRVISPFIDLRFAGEEGFGPGLWREALDLYFQCLPRHAAFVLDEQTSMLSLRKVSVDCDMCSQVSHSQCRVHQTALRSLSTPSTMLFLQNLILKSRVMRWNSADELDPVPCTLGTLFNRQIFLLLLQKAVAMSFKLPYNVDPELLCAAPNFTLQARLDAGCTRENTMLSLMTDEEVSSLDVGPRRVADVLGFCLRHADCTTTTTGERVSSTFLEKLKKYAAPLLYMGDPRPSILMLTDGFYKQQFDNTEFWNNPQAVCLLFAPRAEEVVHWERLARSVICFGQSWTLFQEASIAMLKLNDEQTEEVLELADPSHEDDDDDDIEEQFSLLRKCVMVCYLYVYIGTRTAEQRRQLYKACTGLSRSAIDTKSLLAAVNEDILTQSLAVPHLDAGQFAAARENLLSVDADEVAREWHMLPAAELLAKKSRQFLRRSGQGAICVRITDNLRDGGALPRASTCSWELTLYNGLYTYAEFERRLDIFLDHSVSFGAL